MPTWNRRRIMFAVAGAVLLAGSAITVALLTDPEPELDQNLWQAVNPVVHAELLANKKITHSVSPGMRWFCAEEPVETRRDGADVRVGVRMTCIAYEQRDGALVERAGSSGPLVVTLTPTPDGHRVREVEVPVDGRGFDASVRRMFSPAGYAVVTDTVGKAGPNPAAEARAAFGLPADAPVLYR
jgi:hypothetical protein